MSSRIYKYVGASYTDAVLASPEHVTLKCSHPGDFNDPYELFLTVDYTSEPELLAYYAEAIGELPQVPTTCFSRSPVVVPMWAHYAEALQGFAVEFDETKLAEAFPGSEFGDVTYQDAAGDGLNELLRRAYYLKKMRYTYMLQGRVFRAAYLTKATCWKYEEERRMIVDEQEIRNDSGLMLMDVPRECVTALLCGPRASPDTSSKLQEMAGALGCSYYGMSIGKTSPTPYFVDGDDRSCHFDGGSLVQSDFICTSCGEPVGPDLDQCSWCQITDAHVEDAARSNPFRMLSHYGMLDSYIERMDAISRRSRNE